MTRVKIKETTSRDSIIKNILTSTEAGLNYLAMIVCKILDLSYDDFTLSLIHPNVSVNENIINSEVDIAMENSDMIVNVEVKTQEDEFDKLFYYNREILDDEMTLEEAKKEAREEALAEGRAEGLKEGRAEGLKEGKTEGIKQSKIDIAKAMLKENCVIELIAKVTNLSIKDIEKLKEELN